MRRLRLAFGVAFIGTGIVAFFGTLAVIVIMADSRLHPDLMRWSFAAIVPWIVLFPFSWWLLRRDEK